MTYQIFEMVSDIRFEPDGYAVINYTLEQGAYYNRYNSYTEAEDYIKQNIEKFEDKTLTILPVLTIGL